MTIIIIAIIGLLHLVTSAPTPIEINRLQIPLLDNRFNIEDKRQNWGLLINGSIYNDNENANYNRPIAIPRAIQTSTSSYPISNAENVGAQTLSAKPESGAPSKAKRFFVKASQVNSGLKLTNSNQPRKIPLQCDIARIKCCINSVDVDNCFKAGECLQMKNTFELCDAKDLQDAIMRVMDLFSS